MTSPTDLILDPRRAGDFAAEIYARKVGYLPDWEEADSGPGRALVEITARYLQLIADRLNHAPDKNGLAFLNLLGLALIPAQSARAPVVFQMNEQASDARAPANTQLAAPAPPEGGSQIIFETERAVGLAAAKLVEVVSVWPGRDQFIDHSESLIAGREFRLFEKLKLQNTPHAIYIAHDVLLAFSGKSDIGVQVELSQAGSAPLDMVWEYWDGKVWRPFKAMKPACQGIKEDKDDGTVGFTRSGVIHLRADCAETKKTRIHPNSYRITAGSLEILRTQGVPEDILGKLEKLEDQRVAGEGSFLRLVEERIGPKAVSGFKASILKAAERGIEGFWIRAVLDQALSPDPTLVLPEIEQIRLGTLVERPLRPTIRHKATTTRQSGNPVVRVLLLNEAGQPVRGIPVMILNGKGQVEKQGETDKEGKIEADADADTYSVEVQLAEGAKESASVALRNNLEITFELEVEGFDPDAALSDATKLDVSKPFFPFGQQAQPGSTFYFASDDAFNKPGAKLQVYVARALSPQDKVNATATSQVIGAAAAVAAAASATALEPVVSWEYWNGQRWAPLGVDADLNSTEFIDITVPDDIAKIEVNKQEAFWMRVRLVSGGFGFANTVTWENVGSEEENSFTYVIAQPPVLAAFRLGYVWQHGPYAPEQVWTYNDFEFEEDTEAAIWPGQTFAPFRRLRDTTPALYLGLDRMLPIDRVSLFFDLVEEPPEYLGPQLVWEYWAGANWRECFVEDETQRLRVPGMISLIGPEDSKTRARFSLERHWLRARLREDGSPGEPECAGILLNSVWASQQQSLANLTLGASTGQPNQVFRFPQIPVLPGAHVEVQELRGARANVEWRILARELSPDRPQLIEDLEELLGREGPDTEVESGGLRLRRDRNKRVTEVWVRWEERPHLFASGPDDRDFAIDRARGRLHFGDGSLGKTPPGGALILARSYRSGGGKVGNVGTAAIRQLLGGIPGVQGVSNPRPAEGGADGETVQGFRNRGPAAVRHRGRAIAPRDYEALARQASAAVAVASAVPTRDPGGHRLGGWITLVIIPASQEPRPWPSFGLREAVRRFIEERVPAGVAAEHQLYVTGPEYRPLDIMATVVPLNHGSDSGAVEGACREALRDFLHPLQGGPAGHGWRPGQEVFLSDVATILVGVPGVDYVPELALLVGGNRQGQSVTMAPNEVVVAGEIRLKLKLSEE